MLWFIVLAVFITMTLWLYANAKAAMAEWQRKNTANAYKRYVKGVRDLEAQMKEDGQYYV